MNFQLSVLFERLKILIALIPIVAAAQIPSADFVVLPSSPGIPAKHEIAVNLALSSPSDVHFDTQASIRAYIAAQARETGVPEAEALFIAQHESQFNPTTVGDTDKTCADGSTMRSRGLWQINSCAWPAIDDATAFSVISSTAWAMVHLKENPEIWSAWFHRNWYTEKL